MKTHFCLLALQMAPLCAILAIAQDEKPASELITKEARQAIDAGLAYLAKQQTDDGAWGTRPYIKNAAISSLAGLAFLSAGHQPGKEPYGEVVAKVVDYVLKCGRDRHLVMPAGFFMQDESRQSPMYSHGYAVLFLAEAHAVLEGEKKKEVKEAVTRGVKIILDAQNKEGGWRYFPEPRDADLSMTVCQFNALLAAARAGIDVPDAAMEKAIGYVRSCHRPKGDGFRYQPNGSGNPTLALSAGALTVLVTARSDDDEVWTKGLAYLRSQRGASIGRDGLNQHHFYHAHYYASSIMHSVGGKDWQEWYPGIRDVLRTRQQKDGGWSGGASCKHHSSALAVLILQMPESRLAGTKR
jgi:prenyltransferase beta subunit